MRQFSSTFQRLKIQTKLVIYYITFVVIITGVMIFIGYRQTVLFLQATVDRETALGLARQIAVSIGIIGLPISMLMIAAVSIMARRITAPLRALSETVSHISDGELNALAPVLSDDEVGALARAFNVMTEKLRKTLADMQDELRERKHAETALRESEERFRKVFHSSPIAICITTLEEGRLLNANDAYWGLTGYRPEQALGRNAKELKLWDDMQARAQFVEDLKSKGSLVSPDDHFFHVDGTLKYVISFYERIQLGNEDCILSMFYDMSTQKLTIQALQQSEARIRALLNAFPDMILELSLDGRVINMVPPKGMETAMPAEMFIGKQIDEVFREVTVSQARFAVQRASESGQLNVFEFESEMGGTPRTMEARLTASAPDTVLMMIRDISQRKWIEQEREKLIQELEIKNAESETLRRSLASIVGTLEFTEIIARILEEIRRVIPYDTASVWRVDGRNQYIISGVDLPSEIEIPGTVFVVDETNSAYPLLMGVIPYILNNNVQAELSDFQEPPHNYVQSWLAIPLKTRGRIIGMINLDGRSCDQFMEHHAELAVTFANQLAIALDNALLFSELQSDLEERRRLISELENKNAESETLRESVAIVAATLEKSEAVDRILEQLERVVPFDSASVQLINDNMLEMVSTRGFSLSRNRSENCFELNEDEPAYPVIRGSLPYLLYDDIQASFPGFSEAPHDRIQAWMAVPLKVKGRMLGIIALDGYRVGQFSENHAQLAVTYANQVAIALENARLFSDLQFELSARKKLISELEDKNTELERFTYTVSHDLKSPLFTIRGFLGYLEQDALSGNQARLKSDIQRIADATDKMQRLLNELLELSRVGRLKNESTYFSFAEIAREASELVQGQIMERGITISIDPNLPTVYGDHPRLTEVLQNLLDNAAKFMGDQKEPRIEIGYQGQDAERGMPIFYVRDNGIGIAPEHFERVFGLFNKLDPKTDGTGIGLALVKRIIEVHEGRIWVESKVGSGATFFFTLPEKPRTDSVL
jgi:PAS domain S-box-containing protein